MLEDNTLAMEKRPQSRQSAVQSKSSLTPERKTEFSTRHNGRRKWKDASNPGGRTLEPTQTPAKPAQKWNRWNGDKRPRQRGYYDSRQSEEVADPDDGMAVFSTSSRKGNANELLRFHFNPRDCDSRSQGRYSGYRGGGGNYGRARKTVRYNKEQFLQASCQFVVRNDGEYSQQAVDPDSLVKWEMVELVRVFSTESVKCPICLNVPFAGKITKCGHIYCWACMIRYLALGEKDERNCPICFDSVKTEDLKSVQWVEVPDYKVGDSIEMKLMRKSKGSVYVCPKSDWADRHGKPQNFKDGENTKYAKLLVAEKDQIQREVIDLEKTALMVQYEAAEEMEKPFISMAQELLKIREDILQALTFESKSDVQSNDIHDEDPAIDVTCCENEEVGSSVQYADAFEDEVAAPLERSLSSASTHDHDVEPNTSGLDAAESIFSFDVEECENNRDDQEADVTPSPPTAPETRRRMDSECSLPFGSPVNPYTLDDQPVGPGKLSPEEVHDNLELPCACATIPKAKREPPRPKDTYYFYQAASGQPIFIHSINYRCLQQEYGSLENCPETLTANIVAINRQFITEDIRKRLRYLNHLPLTCEFYTVELNLKPPVISKDTFKMFKKDIDNLRRERQKRFREEKQLAKKIEYEQRNAGYTPGMQIPLDNTAQFPACQQSPHSPPTQDEVENMSDNSATSADHQDTATSWGPQHGTSASPPAASSWDGKSFANIAVAGAWSSGASAQKWRPTSGGALGTGRSTLTPQTRLVPASQGEGSDEELAAPSYTDSMAAAMDSLDIALCSYLDKKDEASPQSPEKCGGGGKKKKKKEKFSSLFSTSMARKS